MNLTPYHAKFFAYELTRRCPSDSVERLVGALADAQVDLNPHQVKFIGDIEAKLTQTVSSREILWVRWTLR